VEAAGLDHRVGSYQFRHLRMMPRVALEDTEMAQPEEPSDRAIRVPAHIIETVNKVVRTSRQMLPEIGREPTPEELAEKLAMPLDKVHKVLAIAKRPIRLETPIESG
jgi:DNA-directed RNA polymerase sigma subunit (sigma70/sigma32)